MSFHGNQWFIRMSISWEEGEELDFVTLAKAGGRKDLLYHLEHERHEKPQSYPPSVQWFSHPSPPPKKPTSPYKSPLADSWMMWDTEQRLPEIQTLNTHPASHTKKNPNLTTKLPSLSQSGDQESMINMRRLLSLDYQREWLEEKERRKKEMKRRAKAKRLAQKKKLEEHTIKQRTVNITDSPPKQRFIMKRFAKVPPKLKLPPL